MARDWSLVAFTVIGQTAVGLFLAAGGVLYFTDFVPDGIAGPGSRLILVLGVLGLLAAGLAASFFHLRRPRRAFRAICNVRSSWLSREILSLLLFLALLISLAVGEWMGGGEGASLTWLFAITGLAGFLFLVCMVMIYALPAVPSWDRVSTPVSFFLTAFISGTLGASLVLKLAGGMERFWRPWAAASVISLALGFIVALVFFPRYGLLDGGEGPSLLPPGPHAVRVHILRLVLLALGTVLTVASQFSAAFLSALAGETAGRFLFYGLRGQAGRGAVERP